MTRTNHSNSDTFVPSDAQYRSLFEEVPIGLYITTPEGRIVDANAALVRLLGFPCKAALLGVMASDLYVNIGDRERQHLLFQDHLPGSDFEMQLRRFDGELIWVRDTCRVIRDDAGRILCFEGSLQDVTEQRASEKRLNHMARHDPLTGVYNRYALSEVVEKEASRALRYRRPIGVLMIDVNRFKEVNDRFGHAAGDKLLKHVAKVLSSTVRDSDYVVRYGGDEFLIMLLETNGETQIVRDRIIEEMASRPPVDSRIDFTITLSIGIAFWKPEDNQSMEVVLSQADQSMYAEKRRQAALRITSNA